MKVCHGCLILLTVAIGFFSVGSSQEANETSPDATQRVWTAEWKNTLDDPGRPYSRFSRWAISFDGVEQIDSGVAGHWVSRRWTWNLNDVYRQFGTIAYDPDAGRYTVNVTKTCRAGDSLELGAGDGSAGEGMPTLQAQCEEVVTPVNGSGPGGSRSFTEDTNQPPTVSLPQDGCSESRFSRYWQGDSVGTSLYTLTVSPYIDAVIQVSMDGEYGQFVPAPGKTITFTAQLRTSTPARFRFELTPDRTSSFPGYATNANIDDMFFFKHGLGHLRGVYGNEGPDLIFDRERYGVQEWSRRDLTVVETRLPENGAVVTVTAMDYGAVGQLRAFVQTGNCGGWQPVPVQFGRETRASISIPLDEDDNLMADALDAYHFVESGADDDAVPTGNGMAGDGLTAFEEYRGFVTRGGNCGNEATEAIYDELQPGLSPEPAITGWNDEHVRTIPNQKDLFIHTPDPELAQIVPLFAWSTGLTTHLLCEPHYESNDSRRVNFTLHEAGLRVWNGRAIAQEEPQHGIYLEPVDSLGFRGLAIPTYDGYMGPPKFTKSVQVIKPRPESSNAAHRGRLDLESLAHTVVHELGHAAGIPHHGDSVDATWRLVPGRGNIVTWLSLQQHAGGPPDYTEPDSLPELPDATYRAIDGRQYLNSLLIEPGAGCVEGARDAVLYKDNRFAGCEAESIARRGQQNSGDFECPMRYSGSDYYEAPGTTAQFRGTALVQRVTFGRRVFGTLVDAWGGTLMKYRNDLDRDGRGRFCSRINGTGINDLPGDQNHAGDAGREKPCAEYIVVNDLAARGVPIRR